jgi:SAM-dependent methyltransferase
LCNQACIDFGRKHLTETDIRDKHIIEVGSLDVNGSLRPYLVSLRPKLYIGVDINAGSGVDEICSAEELVSHFGEEKFDVLISTELLEHIRNWRIAISNMKRVVKPRGVILITTRSRGAEYHGFPYDFWRFERSDMEKIFADFEIEVLLDDPLSPGVLMKARKREPFIEVDCKEISLYSVLVRKKLVKDPRISIAIVQFFRLATPIFSKILPESLKKYLKSILNKIAQNR